MRAEQQIIALATEKTAFGNPRKPLSRVDRASTGPVDLVTDRQKYEGLGMLALIIMPVLLVNVVIVTNLAGGFNHWDDLEPHIMSVLSQPPSIVLGVRNATGAFGFLVNNKYYLPLVNTRVTVEAVAVIPEHEFSFCAGIISGSLLDERLAGDGGMVMMMVMMMMMMVMMMAMMTMMLLLLLLMMMMGALGVTDDNGIASFPDLAIISGPPGAYTFNATAYLEGDDINPITNVRSASYIPMWSTIEISPAREAPRAVEYNKLFDGTDLFCLNDLDTGVDTCAQADSPELLPPEASVSYSGSGVLDNATALTLFVVANFSEALLPNLVVTRTSDPQRVGSVDRMARLSWGAAGSNLVQAPLGDSGTVTFDKFRVLGANNPTLFLAYYCAGVFRLYNENWASEDRGGTMAALEGDKWVGAQRGAQIDEISVAVGDATYLPQVELTDYPKEVVEGEEFSVYLNVYSFSYPRSRQRVFFVAGVTLFAECIPVDGIPATNAHDFQSYRKVLLGGASFVTTSEQAVFPTGMDGTYRIRIYSEGLFVAETVDIVVRSMVNYVRVGLPYSLQALYGDPGCAAEWAPAVMDNSIEDDQAICLSLPTFAPLQGGLPYVDAFVCNVPLKANEKASLAQSCVPVTGKRVRVSMLSGTAKTDAVPLNFFPGTVERRWDFAGTDMALGNITHLSNNNVMNGAIPTFVKFSVGGVDSATVIAIEPADLKRVQDVVHATVIAIEPADLEKVQDVVQYCGAYAPVAHIEILNYASRPTRFRA
ncbi:hypothetical protein T484DRAFT_1806655 [Baffinella frigidus]|nr:hypothetical protein T484DRAFT_1806655 [Cryptophyta sp. CCMP2293]